jgi:hypothetical protein
METDKFVVLLNEYQNQCDDPDYISDQRGDICFHAERGFLILHFVKFSPFKEIGMRYKSLGKKVHGKIAQRVD